MLPLLMLAGCADSESLEKTNELRQTKVEKPLNKESADKIEVGKPAAAPAPMAPEDQKVEPAKELQEATVEPAPYQNEKGDWIVLFPEHQSTVSALQKKAEAIDKLNDAEYTELLKKYVAGVGATGDEAKKLLATLTDIPKEHSGRSSVFTYYQFAFNYATAADSEDGLNLSKEKARKFVEDGMLGMPGGFGIEFIMLHQKAFVRLRNAHCPDCFDRDAALKTAKDEAIGAIVTGMVSPDLRTAPPSR